MIRNSLRVCLAKKEVTFQKKINATEKQKMIVVTILLQFLFRIYIQHATYGDWILSENRNNLYTYMHIKCCDSDRVDAPLAIYKFMTEFDQRVPQIKQRKKKNTAFAFFQSYII